MGFARNVLQRSGGREESQKMHIQEQDQQQQQQGLLYVKVMTDEQLELLRKQISVYATICEQLVEMHKTLTSQQDSLPGMRLGNVYCDSLMNPGVHKITTRQRWAPTPVQLQILENIFEQGNGTPGKQRIKEITNELSQHGQISETNVYNWFQNRRARSKRKQPNQMQNNAESEVETEIDSPKEKKAKPEDIQNLENQAHRLEDRSFPSTGMNSEEHALDPQLSKSCTALPLGDPSKSSGSMGRMSFYENILPNPRIGHHMTGKVEVSGSYSSFGSEEGFDMVG